MGERRRLGKRRTYMYLPLSLDAFLLLKKIIVVPDPSRNLTLGSNFNRDFDC